MQVATSIATEFRNKPVAFILLSLLCVVIALISYRYVPAIGEPPGIIAGNRFRFPWLAIHAGSAATALLLGPAQFISAIRQRMPALHRWVGRAYVAGCIIGSVSGLFLAYGATTGPTSAVGFGLLSIAWFFATWMAWRAAVQRKFTDHQTWMIRSFALTCSAVTLRLYLPVGAIMPVPFEAAYQFISFACWIPNVIFAELFALPRLQRSRADGSPAR